MNSGELPEHLVRVAIDAWLHHVPDLPVTDVDDDGK
jgi:hypothetical protein